MSGLGRRVLLVLLTVWPLRSWGQLVVSELLYEPRSGEAEYVELCNVGGEKEQLADYHIVRWVGDSLGRHYELPELEVGVGEYVVLTKDRASVLASYRVEHPERLGECSLPTYPNAGGAVVLCLRDSTVVERFDYSPTMHSQLLRDRHGVALERRSFDQPVNEMGNWFSASSTSGFGTPTATNSQSMERLALENDFECSGEVLSPDGDGYQDEWVVSYRMQRGDLLARAEVYDRGGRRVRRLLNGDLLGAAGHFGWEGRDEDGSVVPTGQYVVLITLYDLAGMQQVLRRVVAVMR